MVRHKQDDEIGWPKREWKRNKRRNDQRKRKSGEIIVEDWVGKDWLVIRIILIRLIIRWKELIRWLRVVNWYLKWDWNWLQWENE